MNICFSTLGCPQWSWWDIVAYGTQFGYQGVEVRMLEGDTELLERAEFQPAERARRRRELSDAGFRISGLASSVRFHDAEKSVRAGNVETGRAYLDLAKELGADFIRVFGDIVPEGNNQEDVVAQVAEGLNELGAYAETLQLRVVLETHGDFSSSQLVEATMNQVTSSAAGVLWDTHHPWRFCDESLATTFARLQPWIMHTHWKDSVPVPHRGESASADEAAARAHAIMGGHRHADYVLFGGGEFPALECLQLLKSMDYDGWYSLEWEKAWHPEIEDPEIALPLFPGKLRELERIAAQLS